MAGAPGERPGTPSRGGRNVLRRGTASPGVRPAPSRGPESGWTVAKEENEERVRFGRAQKFRLSSKGGEAEAAYTLMVAKARDGVGRAQFDAARAAWSAPLGLTPEDGLFLVEFARGEHTITEAVRGLDDCASPKEVKAAVQRLIECGMLEPVPAPVEPPAPPPRRYW